MPPMSAAKSDVGSQSVIAHVVGTFRGDGVIWVDVFTPVGRHRLQGMDYMWVDETSRSWGMFNHPDNYEWYGGAVEDQARAWALVGEKAEGPHVVVTVDDAPLNAGSLPGSAIVWDGLMLSDADASLVGIL